MSSLSLSIFPPIQILCYLPAGLACTRMVLVLILLPLRLLLLLQICSIGKEFFTPSFVHLQSSPSFCSCCLFIIALVILLAMIYLQTCHKHSSLISHFCSSRSSLDSPIIFLSLLVLITCLCCSLSFLFHEYFQVFMLFHSFLLYNFFFINFDLNRVIRIVNIV